MIRLPIKLNASIEEIGNPNKLIAFPGPFVIGNTCNPDELFETQVKKLGDQMVLLFLLYCLPNAFY